VRFCGSLFLPGGELATTTGYQILCNEPLAELELDPARARPPKCFDLLLLNETLGSVLAVEVKIDHSAEFHGFEGFVQETWAKADDLLEWQGYLAKQVGVEIGSFEIVMCVKGGQEQRAAASLARLERNVSNKGGVPAHLLKLWYCDMHHGGRLQLFSSMDRAKSHWSRHSSEELTRRLVHDGVEISGSEMATVFYKSPTACVASEFVGSLVELQAQAKEEVDVAGSISFDEGEVARYYEERLNHYQARPLAERMAKTALTALLCGDLVEERETRYALKGAAVRPRTAILATREAILARRADECARDKAAAEVIRRFSTTEPLLFPYRE